VVTFNNVLNIVLEWSFLKLDTQMVKKHSKEIWYPMEWNAMKHVIGYQLW